LLIKKKLLTLKVRAGRIRPPLPILNRVKRKIKKKISANFSFLIHVMLFCYFQINFKMLKNLKN